MTKLNKRVFSILPVVILIGNELIRTFIRPIYGKKEYGLLSEMLGWLPNFLAPFGFIIIGISMVILMQDVGGKHFTKQQYILLLSILIVIGLSGFVGHEVIQKGTGLFYDLNDIYATFAGILTGSLLFYWIIIRQLRPTITPSSSQTF